MTHIKLTTSGPYHLTNPADPNRTQYGEAIDLQLTVDTTDKPGNRPQCVMCWVKRPSAWSCRR